MIDKIGPVIASLVALAIGAVVTVLMINASGALYDELRDHGDINGEAFTVVYLNNGQRDGNAIDRGTAFKVENVTSGTGVTAKNVDIEPLDDNAIAGTTPGPSLYTLQGTEISTVHTTATGKKPNAKAQLTLTGANWEEAMEAAQRLAGLNNVVTSLLPFVVSLSFIVTVFAKSFLRQGSLGSIKEILMGEIVVLVITLVAIYVAPSLFQFIEGLYFAVSSDAPMLSMFGQALDVLVSLMPSGIVLAIVGVNTDRSLRATTGSGLYERGKGYFGRGRRGGMSMGM